MKKLYSFLVSLLVIPFSANIGLGSLYFYSEIALFTKEAKATNWNAFNLNFKKGKRYLDNGEYQKAVDAYNKVIKIYALDGPSFYNRGTAYLGLEKYDEAIKDFLKSIKYDNEKGNQFAFNNIAVAYDNLGDYKNALKYINLAIDAYPKSGLYFQNRGYYYLELENYKEAEKDYKKAKELYLKYKSTRMFADCPKVKNLEHCKLDSWFYNDLGLAKENLGNFRGALENYDKAIEINYPNPNEEKYILFNNRGNVKYELGDEKGACKDYKFAASIGDEEGVEWLKSKDGKWCGKMEF